ncbi:MAG: hypothetical protein ACREPN_02840 [Rudaea sp.]
MLKSILLVVLALAPVAAIADVPMSIGGESNPVAGNAAPAAPDATAVPASDPADAVGEAAHAPMATRASTHTLQPDSAAANVRPARTPARVGADHNTAAHKKSDGTRWQSLLPGVMK